MLVICDVLDNIFVEISCRRDDWTSECTNGSSTSSDVGGGGV